MHLCMLVPSSEPVHCKEWCYWLIITIYATNIYCTCVKCTMVLASLLDAVSIGLGFLVPLKCVSILLRRIYSDFKCMFFF